MMLHLAAIERDRRSSEILLGKLVSAEGNYSAIQASSTVIQAGPWEPSRKKETGKLGRPQKTRHGEGYSSKNAVSNRPASTRTAHTLERNITVK
jgi:hypothetical protein